MTDYETDIQGAILKWLRKRNWVYIKTHPGLNGVPKGWPDITVFVPGGEVVFLEVKKPGEELEPLQDQWAMRLRKGGYQHWVVNNPGHAIRLLGRAYDRGRARAEP